MHPISQHARDCLKIARETEHEFVSSSLAESFQNGGNFKIHETRVYSTWAACRQRSSIALKMLNHVVFCVLDNKVELLLLVHLTF